MMGVGYHFSPSYNYNGYNGVGRKGIDNVINLLIAKQKD